MSMEQPELVRPEPIDLLKEAKERARKAEQEKAEMLEKRKSQSTRMEKELVPGKIKQILKETALLLKEQREMPPLDEEGRVKIEDEAYSSRLEPLVSGKAAKEGGDGELLEDVATLSFLEGPVEGISIYRTNLLDDIEKKIRTDLFIKDDETGDAIGSIDLEVVDHADTRGQSERTRKKRERIMEENKAGGGKLLRSFKKDIVNGVAEFTKIAEENIPKFHVILDRESLHSVAGKLASAGERQEQEKGIVRYFLDQILSQIEDIKYEKVFPLAEKFKAKLDILEKRIMDIIGSPTQNI